MLVALTIIPHPKELLHITSLCLGVTGSLCREIRNIFMKNQNLGKKIICIMCFSFGFESKYG